MDLAKCANTMKKKSLYVTRRWSDENSNIESDFIEEQLSNYMAFTSKANIDESDCDEVVE